MRGILEGFEDKSFLSFTFDGKAIEEFGFAVVYNGDRLSTALQPEFSNSTSVVPGRLGSVYWGTDITGYTLELNLATDRATARQVANFKQHFMPGKYGILVLAECEYCYCYAYINAPSTFTFVPFQESTQINGEWYEDTIYKGEATLNFFIPQVYFYSNLNYAVYGDEYKDKPWFLASGLPLKSSIVQNNVYLANGIIANQTSPSSTFYAYNAGNAPANANVKFTLNIAFTSGRTVPWTNIVINDIVISKPRVFRDIDYTLNLLNTYSTYWTTVTKAQTLDELRENLDSELRSELIGIVNATGSGLNWTTPTAASTAIRNLIHKKTFYFSIDGIEVQSIMEATLTLHNFSSRITTYSADIVENIGDSTNGRYLIIEGSEGLKSNGKVNVQTITTNRILDNLEIYFPNTYMV